MTGDTTPQQQAVATLVEYFQPDSKGRIAVEPAKDKSQLTAATSTGDGLMDFRYLTFGEIVDCLADAGLLCSSPVQPKDEDGSLRSVPSALRSPAVSYDSLVDWVARLEVTVKPVNGVVTIMAESMADRFAEFLGANGIEVSRG